MWWETACELQVETLASWGHAVDRTNTAHCHSLAPRLCFKASTPQQWPTCTSTCAARTWWRTLSTRWESLALDRLVAWLRCALAVT